MKLVASLEAIPQGTKTSDHGTFSLYINIIFQIMRAFLTDHGYVRQYNRGDDNIIVFNYICKYIDI